VTVVLWSALAVIAPTDVVRLRVPAVERVYERLLGFLMRESERVRTPSFTAFKLS
jgi:diacylglycerol kinase (CTP)